MDFLCKILFKLSSLKYFLPSPGVSLGGIVSDKSSYLLVPAQTWPDISLL